MRLGALHRHHRLPVALALLGMTFYAVLVPWHTVSQVTLQLPEANVSMPPCHQAIGGEAPKNSKPEKPYTKCPICNGFAALQMAVSGPACPIILRIAESDARFAATEDGVAATLVHAPQIRGPPNLST
jgi:hypothetical protein